MSTTTTTTTTTKNKLIHVFNLYREFKKKYSGSKQTFIKHLSSDYKHIYNEIQNDKSLKYLIKFNLPWLQMNLIQWIQHHQHPCPIITISISNSIHERINNFDNLIVYEIENKSAFKISQNFLIMTPNIAFKSHKCFITFQKKCDEHIVDDNNNKLIQKFNNNKLIETVQLSINQILEIKHTKDTFYYLQYSNIPPFNIEIHLIIQACCINARYGINSKKKKKCTIIQGSKFKIQILQSQSIWDEYNSNVQFWFYKFSNYLFTISSFKHDCVFGRHHYYYQYIVKYAPDILNKNISYCYIEYISSKVLPSISEYYEFNKITKKQHNELFKYFCDKTGFDFNVYNHNIYISHIFWIGITVHDNVINMKIKQLLYDKIKDWKNNGPPSGIHLEKSPNRWKFFIMYKYFYRLKNMTTAQINKANSIAGGLRPIRNAHTPMWLQKFIQYLKDVNFIPNQTCINQIGINYYFNEKSDSENYNGIDPHLEATKFSVVYSISIYGNSNNVTSLSFNLSANKSCGDIKVLMKDCCGIKLHS